MDTPLPDRVIVRRLRMIEPALDVLWCASVERWGVYHDLPGNPDAWAGQVAQTIQQDLAMYGYVIPLDECQDIAQTRLQDARLVCYVTNEDGSYCPLDDRIVAKIARMDWYRRHCGVRDWKAMLDMKADMARDQRERAEEGIWGVFKRDKVFAHCLSNVLWGVDQALHFQVPGGGGVDDATTEHGVRDGAAGGPEALGVGGGGATVPTGNGAVPPG